MSVGASEPATRPTAHEEAAGWLARRLSPLARRWGWSVAVLVLWVTALTGLVVAAAATAAAAAVYDAVAERDGVARFDAPVLREAIAWRTPLRDHLAAAVSAVGGPIGMPLLAVLVVAVMVWRWRSRQPLVLMVIATAGSLAMTAVGKLVVGRVRPDHRFAVPPFESSPSFPSGHTLNSTVVAGVLTYLVLRNVASPVLRVVTVVGAVTFATAMGLSRVFLGHHWLTDVMAGWALGVAWVVVVVSADRLQRDLRGSRADRRGVSPPTTSGRVQPP